jgi:alkanesulfonate monooxygenase
VQRTLTLLVVCGRDDAEFERRVRYVRGFIPGGRELPLDEVLQALRTRFTAVVGTPDAVVEQLRGYAAAGVAEVMVQWFDLDDLEGLQVLADVVLPALGQSAG